MSNKKITDLTAYTTPVSSDVLPIVDVSNSATKKVTLANLFNILSSAFRIKDSSDTTKKVAFDVSGITTATTRTVTMPDADFTPVGTTLTQTLTNKQISTGTKINTSGLDATGTIYYRASDGSLTPLAPGAAGTILDISAGGLPEYIPNPAAADASTTVKGVVEIATTAEITAGTSTGATGAVLVVPADAVGAVGASKLVQFTAATKYPAADGSLITNIGNRIATTSAQVTINSSENTILTGTILGGTLGTSGMVFGKVYMRITSSAASGGLTLTLKYKYGSTTVITQTVTIGGTSNTTAIADFSMFANASTSAQTMSAFMQTQRASGVTFTNGNVAYGTATENSTGDLTFSVTAQLNEAVSGTCDTGFLMKVVT